MTTAHRPTFDPAQGKESQRGPAYHQRLLPAHKVLKTRQEGQGTTAETSRRDLRAQLLQAEAAHFAKTREDIDPSTRAESETGSKRRIESGSIGTDAEEDEDIDAKRRRILEETRDIDADSDGSEDESSEEDSDEEDETAELMRELEKIKRERAEQREREEAEREAQEQEQRDRDIATGNPLLNSSTRDFNIKRRWDDDVVFKNQARGTETKRKKEFVNDLLRSDFHRKFMSKYVR